MGLKKKVNFFSYPWGLFSPGIEQAVKSAGYRAAFTTNFKPAEKSHGADSFAIKRITAYDIIRNSNII